MKLGIIGGSRIASRHIKALSNVDKFKVAAISGRSMANLDRITDEAESFGVSNINKYTDYKEMLSNEKLNLILIATESGRHCEIALECMDLGLHVFVEKPMALSVFDCERMIDRAENMGVRLFSSHQVRFGDAVSSVKDILRKGSFGKLLHGVANIRWNRNKEYYAQADWRGTLLYDGGMLLNQCIHSIDILRWYMDSEPAEVVAFTDNLLHPEIEVEDLGLGMIKFKNGSYGVIEGTVNVYPKNLEETLSVFGEFGTLRLGGKSLDTILHWDVKDSIKPEVRVTDDYALDCYVRAYEDIYESVKYGRDSVIDGKEAIKTIALIEAMYVSSKTGMTVKV